MFVLATVRESTTWGTEVVQEFGRGDALLGRIASDGRLGWARMLGSDKADVATDLAVDGSGGLLSVVLMTGAAMVDGQRLAGPGTFVIRQKQSNGDVLWYQKLDYRIYFRSRIATRGNAVFVATPGNDGSLRLWKLDLDLGVLLWMKDLIPTQPGPTARRNAEIAVDDRAAYVATTVGPDAAGFDMSALSASDGKEVWTRRTPCTPSCAIPRLRVEKDQVCAGGGYRGSLDAPEWTRQPSRHAGFISCWSSRDGQLHSRQGRGLPVLDFVRRGERFVIASERVGPNEKKVVVCSTSAHREACDWTLEYQIPVYLTPPPRLYVSKLGGLYLLGTFEGSMGRIESRSTDAFVASLPLD